MAPRRPSQSRLGRDHDSTRRRLAQKKSSGRLPSGRERLDVGRLVRRCLVREGAWQLRDSAGRWVCPYCAEVSSVSIPATGADGAVIAGIVAHVELCGSFDPDAPDQHHDLAALQQKFNAIALRQKLADKMRGLIRDFPVWRVVDRDNFWVCPYCAEPTPSIVVQTFADLEGRAATLIVEEVLDRCAMYRARAAVIERAEELIERVSGGRVVPGGNPASPQPEAPRALTITTTRVAVEAEAARLAAAGARGFANAVEAEPAEEVDSGEEVINAFEVLAEPVQPYEGAAAFEDTPAFEALPGFDDPPAEKPAPTSAPVIPGYAAGLRVEPCLAGGGDFHDAIDLGQGRWGLVVGDVSGRGADAGQKARVVRRTLRQLALAGGSPRTVLELANPEITRALGGQTIITVLYGVLDTRAHAFAFVRAGHEPLVVRRASGLIEHKSPGGMAVGVRSGAAFAAALVEVSLALAPRDLVALYTDGLVKCVSSAGEPFGIDALDLTLGRNASRGPQAVVDALAQAAKVHGGAHPADYDHTALAFQRLA